ncbi:MAG: hypothetical protein OEU36_10330 [Gammaproteobacteria bacterium]|nr:hypothetical protein [Gammaproteobacteria bacterium]
MQAPADVDRINKVIDLDRYPIHVPQSEGFAKLVCDCVEQLADDGCRVIEGFLRPGAVARLAQQAEALTPLAHRSDIQHNPYFSPDDETFPIDHPRRHFQWRNNGFVCTDLIPAESELWTIFNLAAMTEFVQQAFSKKQLFQYEDPLAQMPINTMRPGDQFPWHFDTNEFTVTIVLQVADEGGLFEYAPNIRSTDDENYEAVATVLAGDKSLVNRVVLNEGDIQLFTGRFTLHRVTQVAGKRNRHVAIPSWAAAPEMIGQPHRTKQIYGRLTEAHHQAMMRGDVLAD